MFFQLVDFLTTSFCSNNHSRKRLITSIHFIEHYFLLVPNTILKHFRLLLYTLLMMCRDKHTINEWIPRITSLQLILSQYQEASFSWFRERKRLPSPQSRLECQKSKMAPEDALRQAQQQRAPAYLRTSLG